MIERLMLGLVIAGAAWWVIVRRAKPDPREWLETEIELDRLRRNGL